MRELSQLGSSAARQRAAADRLAAVLPQNGQHTGGGAGAASDPLLAALDSQGDDSPPVRNATSGGRECLVVVGVLDG